ncbi:MAG: hypothetical protein LBN93_10190 [Candidatus Symbiothrix sp.]|jgi:uncharacterized membrane protein HdeD (DUF308 family)|nr:hypothetical protein [Candidatus Symbiothrix sp.]
MRAMQFIRRNLGLISIAAGILLLAIPYFVRLQTNTTLFSGWLLVVIGIIAYILHKKKRKK